MVEKYSIGVVVCDIRLLYRSTVAWVAARGPRTEKRKGECLRNYLSEVLEKYEKLGFGELPCRDSQC